MPRLTADLENYHVGWALLAVSFVKYVICSAINFRGCTGPKNAIPMSQPLVLMSPTKAACLIIAASQVTQEAESLKAEANKLYVAGQYSEALVSHSSSLEDKQTASHMKLPLHPPSFSLYPSH